MICKYFRFESLSGKILPTRNVLKLFRSPFLLLQVDDSRETPPNFVADFATADEPPSVSIEVQESHPRKKRFVEIMSNIVDFDHPNNLYTIDDDINEDITDISNEDLGDKDRKKKIDKKKRRRMRKKERKMKNEVRINFNFVVIVKLK